MCEVGCVAVGFDLPEWTERGVQSLPPSDCAVDPRTTWTLLCWDVEASVLVGAAGDVGYTWLHMVVPGARCPRYTRRALCVNVHCSMI